MLKGSTSFSFAQNTIYDFQNTVLNTYWHCLRQMPQKGGRTDAGAVGAQCDRRCWQCPDA